MKGENGKAEGGILKDEGEATNSRGQDGFGSGSTLAR